MDKFWIIKNNENFFLEKKEIDELLKKRNVIGRNKSITYKNYILRNSEDFDEDLYTKAETIVNTDNEYDLVYILWNYNRIKKYVAWMDIYDDRRYNIEYNKTLFNSKEEIKQFINNEDYIIFDLETTWFWKLDQITQFWWIIYKKWKASWKLEFLLKPYKMKVWQEVQELTWITNYKMEKEGKNIDKVADAIYNLLHDKNIIAHNIAFDYWKIQEFFIDLNRDIPLPKMIIDSIDMTKKIAQEDLIIDHIKWFSLNYLVKNILWINISNLEERHTALFDVVYTKKVIDLFLEDRKKWEIEIKKDEKKSKKEPNKDQNCLF